MKVNTQQIQIGAMSYYNNEIAKKTVGIKQFGAYFLMPIVGKKVENYVNAFAENELTKEFFDENRNVDIDVIYNMAKDAIKKSGQFVAFGLVFNENDIDKLYTYIKHTQTGGII